MDEGALGKYESYSFKGLAVRTGQISFVTIPGAALFLGSGMTGLAGIGRKTKTFNPI
jgi:hypothetical protein